MFCDLESRSRADIECTGSRKYARHPSTEVLVLKYGFTVDDVRTWHPGDPVPAEFNDRRMIFAAQRAEFEIAMFQEIMAPQHGFPYLPDSRWICSAAACGYSGLPQGLQKVSTRLDLGDFGKDQSGHANMLKLCKPVRTRINGKFVSPDLIDGIFYGGEFDNDAAKHAKNDEYCGQDVIAEIVAYDKVTKLPKREQQVWQLHRKINTRGVPVDLELCDGAVRIIEAVSDRYLDELRTITGDPTITVDCRDRVKAFVNARGANIPNLQEGTINDLLPAVEDEHAKRVLEIRQLLTSASIKKFQATIDMADDDWRCRDAFIYYGAGPGRWASGGPQFHNMTRPGRKPKEIEAAIPYIQDGDVAAVERLSNGDPFGLLSDCVRSIICAPPGKKIIVSDFKSVEARKLAWLSGAEKLLQQFRDNEELYVNMACEILGCTFGDIALLDAQGEPIRDEKGELKYVEGGKEKRQLGKVPFLGAGYQMGWSHLKEVALKQAKVELTDDMAQTIVDVFRGNNPEIPQFWRDIENGAKWCVRTGKRVAHPKFRFRMHGDWLVMRIPSGRELFYFKPRFQLNDRGREELVYESPRGTKQLYGGLLTENITQASSRDLLADCLIRMDVLGLDLFMHCHDESVTECDANDDTTESLVDWAMRQVEPWADGMPLGAETHSGFRYTK